MNPRKADLQRWREHFAEQLQELGIECNATPRAARGVTRKPTKQVIRHINQRTKTRVTASQEQAAIDEVNG